MPLSALGKIITGNTPSKKVDDYWATRDIPFIKPNDIGEAGVTFLEHGAEHIASEAARKARLVGSNTVLVTCIGTIAKVAIVGCDRVAFNQQINAICIDERTVNPLYLAYAIKAHEDELRALANAAVVPIVNKSQFSSFILAVDPNLGNQNEIAARLKAIEAQQKLMEMKSECLDSLVKSRFVEMFGDPTLPSPLGWGHCKLGEVLLIERGGSPRPIKSYLTNSSNGINWIKIGDADERSRFIASAKEKISPDGVKKSRKVEQGDFILSNSMSFGRPYILKIDGCIHDGWLVLRDRGKHFEKLWLYEALSSRQVHAEFQKLARGGVVNNLNRDLVASVPILIPPKMLQLQFADFVVQVDKLRFAGNHEMNFRCERFTLSWSTMA